MKKSILSILGLVGIVGCSPSPTSVGAHYPSASPSATAASSGSPEPQATPSASASGTPVPLPNTTRPRPELSPTPTPAPTVGPDQNQLSLRDNFFKNYGVNPFVEAATDPLSTFALDVDTASYTLTRGYLNSGALPPAAAVRTEEFLNYFNYHYAQPLSGKFGIYTDLAPSYFGDENTKLMRIGIQGREVLDTNRKQANLTFVIDVSGSMNRDNRLGLVKQSLKLLIAQLRPTDRVGIVVYGTTAHVVLEPIELSNKDLVNSVIDTLRPEGSTNAEAGLLLGYAQASKTFKAGAINRVILCSDGVANVGDTGPDTMIQTIKARAADGIALTTLGFGLNGYNDTLMEQLADQGDGQNAYIDSLDEAKNVLGKQLTSTLQLIAKDAKIQVGFNPEVVDQYRLLGYENRNIADQDFRNDTVDAGDIGSNHSVTALYEVRIKSGVSTGTLATVTLRYKDVDENNAIKEQSTIVDASALQAFSNASGSFRLAASVAEFAEILRQSVFARNARLGDVSDLGRTALTAYPSDEKIQEFMTLVSKAATLKQPSAVLSTEATVNQSQNPTKIPDWETFLLKQLGGKSQK